MFSKMSKMFFMVSCKKLLVTALLFGAVGYFCRLFFVLNSSENNETTETPTRSIKTKEKMDTAQQEDTLSLSTNHQIINGTFCHFETKCETIKCCCIPEQLDPGEVTRTFIESIFKDQCGSNVAINLRLEKSTFPGNELRETWLKTDVVINQLILDNCFLTALSDTAFSSMIYNRTTKLHLLNNNISTLKRATFRHLPNLQNLVIEGNLIRQAERNLLKDVASTLRCLQFEDAIENVQVLRNITGADDLSAVKVLSLRYNHIPIIDSQLFSGVPNIASLYLCSSRVKTVHAEAFQPISRFLKQLVLSDNAIASLPEGLFDLIIRQNADFGLTIDNNPWRCDCSLKWMRGMMMSHPSVIKKNLTCVTPERNVGKSFMSANFCDDDTPLSTPYVDVTTYNDIINKKTTEMTSTSSISSTTRATTVRINCTFLISHSLSQSSLPRDVFPIMIVPPPFTDFTAEQIENGSVLITLPNANDLSLIWFANNLRQQSDITRRTLENSIECVSQVKGSYLLPDLQPRTSYTICLQSDTSFSPLNCLGLTTRPFPGSWLKGIDENVIIAIFVVSLMLVCLMSAVLMFVMVRWRPTMLRGSKRVVIVKRRNVMVLPKGRSRDTPGPACDNAVSTISRGFKDNGYVTPLPMARNSTRKHSKASSEQSDGTSYISGVEPTPSQLNSWRLKKESFYMGWEAEPPPLPPYPCHRAQQLLSTVEDLNENGSGEPTRTV